MSKRSRPCLSSAGQAELARQHNKIFGAKPSREQYVPQPEDMQYIPSLFEKQMGTNQMPQGRT